MRSLLLSQVAMWTGGHLQGGDTSITAVSTDTRAAMPGALFVALKGERFDAHAFVGQAQSQGAAALLVDHAVASALPQVIVADTQQALADLAFGMQAGRGAVVLALTGSNGKTSVKTLLQGILRRVGICHANPGNRNNEIGLPLSVLEAPEDAAFAIYEMGAGKPGDIAYLCEVVTPNVALVNNIAAAHIERLGSLHGIADTKASIYDSLPDDGVAVVNADDAFAPLFMARAAGRRVLRFGLEQDAEVRAVAISLGAGSSCFRLVTPVGDADIALPLPGRHNVANALAAAAMALAAGAPLVAIVDGLQQAEAVKGRQVAHALPGELKVIDDSYNANPGSVAAAIATLASAGVPAWLVLGDMRELGVGAAALHAEAGRQARAAGLKKVWTVGDLAQHASLAFGDGGRHFDSQEALIAALRNELTGPAHVLVKGSRGSAMDKVVSGLLAGEGSHAA